jgi:predicted DNA-binding transcriptional regulator YafY
MHRAVQLSLFPIAANDNAPTAQAANHPGASPERSAMDPEVFRRRVIQAIQERRVCRVVYAAGDEIPRPRDFEPYAIIRVEDHWSVIGFCRLRQGLRTFRSDRVLRFDLLSDAFIPRASVSLERFILRRRGAA